MLDLARLVLLGALPISISLPVAAQSPTRNLFTVENSQFDSGEGFGSTAFSVGDFDGREGPEFAVHWRVSATGGAPAGRVQIYSPIRQELLVDLVHPALSHRPVGIADVNGDGVGELLGASATLTTTLTIVDPITGSSVGNVALQGPANFITLFGPSGDIDGDGAEDVYLVSDRGTGASRTRQLELYSSATPGPAVRVLPATSTHTNPFDRVAPYPDANGDGIEDFLVADRGFLSDPPDRVRLVSGADGAEIWQLSSAQAAFTIIAPVGDLDGDGRPEVFATGSSGPELHSGLDGALLHVLAVPSGQVLQGVGAFAQVGDVNGDQVPDLALGVPRSSELAPDGGAVYVFSGDDYQLLTQSFGAERDATLGRSLLGLGDTDGDGNSDWLVGIPYDEAMFSARGSAGFVAQGLLTQRIFDFESDDSTGALQPNGAPADELTRFGRSIRITSRGANQFGPALFDSSPNGPNASGGDPDLLVDRGNLLILQETPQLTPAGLYASPNDAERGGTLRIELVREARPRSVVLVDIGPNLPAEDVLVRLIDTQGLRRLVTVPGGFTADGAADISRAARVLRLDTLDAQPGESATATTVEEPGFDEHRVVAIEFELNASGAVDDLVVEPGPTVPASLTRLIRRLRPEPIAALFASDVAELGDLDGDGAGEIAVAWGTTNTQVQSGFVSVFRGSDGSEMSELVPPPTAVSGPGPFVHYRAVDSVGDVDGDGDVDLLVSSRVDAIAGQPVGFTGVFDALSGALIEAVVRPTSTGCFAEAQAVLNDVDGDGIHDFAVLACGGPNGNDAVFVYSGATRALLTTLSPAPFAGGLGPELFNVGDVNADGVDDLAAGPDTLVDTPAQAVFSATDGTLLFRGPSSLGSFPGQWSAALGDLNGDGHDDFAYTTSRFNPSAGVADELRVISGATGAVLFELDNSVAIEAERNAVLVASPGDLDGDGMEDLVVAGIDREPIGPAEDRWFVSGYSGGDFHRLFQRFYDPEEVQRISEIHRVGDIDGDGFPDIGVTLVEDFASSSLEIFSYTRPLARVVCTGRPNSTGRRTRLRAVGSVSKMANDLEFHVQDLPLGAVSILAVSSGSGEQRVLGDGALCIDAASIQRVPGIFSGAPIVVVPVDLTAVPTSGAGSAPAAAGSTLYFQAWHRDPGSPSGSNLSDALAIIVVE